MRLGTRVARLERDHRAGGCAVCGGEPGIRFVMAHDDQAGLAPERCAGCGRDRLVIRILAAVPRPRNPAEPGFMDADRFDDKA